MDDKDLESTSQGVLLFPDTTKSNCEQKELYASQSAMPPVQGPHLLCTAQEVHGKETFQDSNRPCGAVRSLDGKLKGQVAVSGRAEAIRKSSQKWRSRDLVNAF